MKDVIDFEKDYFDEYSEKVIKKDKGKREVLSVFVAYVFFWKAKLLIVGGE